MSGAIGIFGKHPGQADFLHAGAGDFVRAGLDKWFEDATEMLRRDRNVLPAGPTAFMFPGGVDPDGALAGVFAPSQDAVGRKFPLILFGVVGARKGPARLAALAAASADFIEGAAGLVMEAADLSVADLTARAQALPSPDASVTETARLDGETVSELGAAIGGPAGVLGYAISTCVTACEQAAKAATAGSSTVVTIDAPASTPTARRFWLDLMAPRLGAVRPTIMLTPGASGRLLAALGTPTPTSMLSFLANPKHAASRFWPLRTDSAAAIEGALQGMTPERRRVLDAPAASLAELLAAFA